MGDISTCLLMLVNKTLKGKEMWSVRFIIMMMQQWWVMSVPAYWHCWTKSKEMWSVSCIVMMNKQCLWPLQTGCMCLVKILLRTTCIESCLWMIECYVVKCVVYIIGCSLHSGWLWIVLSLFVYFSCDFYALALLHLILNVLKFLCSDTLSLMTLNSDFDQFKYINNAVFHKSHAASTSSSHNACMPMKWLNCRLVWLCSALRLLSWWRDVEISRQ